MLRKVLTATALSAILVTGALAQSKNFISEQKSDQFLASKFKGVDVVGTDNQKIGDVNDVLFDKSGKIHALVIGVGGFLGLGAKDVALSMDSFEVMPAGSAGAGGTGGTTGATTGASADANDVKLKLSMTKDELKNAPDFKAYQPPAPARPATTGTSPGGAPGGARPGGTTQ